MFKKFGKELVLVVGNWLASNVKYHEPIRGKSWRDFFKRQDFKSVEKYSGSDKRRLFNRNLAAVLNFRRIVDSLRKTNKTPEVFKRSAPESQPADKPKSIKRSRNTA
ncbi:hypothetical protein IWW39_004486 [Coemansia spiralis]|uniref:Uncharacterized protein n=1 Tax=Coemansia spiralis TaxID=417178 RepID=A0A9W8L3B8_9FUNG|nr:hypothetical protein IWW39_004486 [Coemansia spiralis]